MENQNFLDMFNHDLFKVISSCLKYDSLSEVDNRAIAKKLKEHYFVNPTVDIRSFDALNEFIADGSIAYGVHRFVHLAANYTKVYYYKFTYRGRDSNFLYPKDEPFGKNNQDKIISKFLKFVFAGVEHGDDLIYLFPDRRYFNPISHDDRDGIIVEKFTRIIENFARSG